jgi:phospholipase/carboxylesterase
MQATALSFFGTDYYVFLYPYPLRMPPSSLQYRRIEPRVKSGKKSPTLIMLHGRGADENDLAGLAPYLDPRLLIFSIRAPFPFESGGYTYFRLEADGTADRDMFLESYRRLTQFVQEVLAVPDADQEKIFLMGFSMGTVMAYTLSLTHPDKFAGVVAQSGFVRDLPDLEFQWKRLEYCPFIITHGKYDPIISIELARQTKELFSKSNAEYIYNEYPMGHQINEESLADVSDWLSKRIGGTR